jgi:hypothetical protein
MNSVRKQDKAFRRLATIMAALVVLASSAASQRADCSRAASSRSIATSHAAKKSSDPKALPSAGPSPVNLLAGEQYQTNDHGTHASPQDVAVGDFNQDGYQDVVVVDQTTCVTFMPGNAQGQLGTPVDSCVLPTTGGQSVVAGNFNDDGTQDLAIVSGQKRSTLPGPEKSKSDSCYTLPTREPEKEVSLVLKEIPRFED